MLTVTFTADSLDELAELVRAWQPNTKALERSSRPAAPAGDVRRAVEALQGPIARRLLQRIARTPGEWVVPSPDFCADFGVTSAASLGGAIGSINRVADPILYRGLVETVATGPARWRVSSSDAAAILDVLK